MESTPLCAPFNDNDEYKPMRMPKSSGNKPTHADSLNSFPQPYTTSSTSKYGASSSSTKLSINAEPFIPSRSNEQVDQFKSNNQQTQPNHSRYNQQNHPRQQHYSPRYTNDNQQMNPSQICYSDHNKHMQALTGSIQDRLIIARGYSASTNNYSSPSSKSSDHPNTYNNYHHSRPAQQHRSYRQQSGDDHQTPLMSPGNQSPGVDMENIALEYLHTVIQCLNRNPGQFDAIATRFLNIFEGMENNNYVLCNAMEDIFNESIKNPNFRYMGAKLYNLLHMLNLKKDSLFHVLLKCKLEYHQKELVEYMSKPNQQQKVRETALFLAELYMQLRGDDLRIHLIAENIVFTLKKLLSWESAENMRCICLTLKLAGYDLTADCPADMQQIIAQLDTINRKQPGKYPLLANVISLQKTNWGRKLSSSSSSSTCEEDAEKAKLSAEPPRVSDDPIFYGPDGRELTAEEADFLTSVPGAMTGTGSTDDEDAVDLDVELDPEMDEETENAYSEFCKLNATK